MQDFLDKHLFGIVVVIVMAILATIITCAATYEHDHPCIKSHVERQYVAPTYIKNGDILIPIGGGMQNVTVCDERK